MAIPSPQLKRSIALHFIERQIDLFGRDMLDELIAEEYLDPEGYSDEEWEEILRATQEEVGKLIATLGEVPLWH